MQTIKLNCDIGESFGQWRMGNDELLFPHIDMANLACGFHASDPVTMQRSVELAKEHGVMTGAHIAYQDLLGFGRRSIVCTPQEVETLALYQIGALHAFCKAANLPLQYVKPHGALYNDKMKDDAIFLAILQAIASFDTDIKLMILSTLDNTRYKKIAAEFGVELICEVFADRNYLDNGHLVPRREKDAVITDEEQMIDRMKRLKEQGFLESINGKKLYLDADTICVHGDNEQAVRFITRLKESL